MYSDEACTNQITDFSTIKMGDTVYAKASEVDVSGLYVKGSFISWNDDTRLTRDTDGTYYYEWIATSSQGTFALDTGAWQTTYRGTEYNSLYRGFAEGETKATLYPLDDYDCMPIAMEPGATYRMIVTGGGARLYRM